MIRLILQLNLFCALFTLMVRYAVRNGAIDGLYFYPKEVHDRAIEIGLMGRDTMNRKRKRFMMLFYVVMLTALVFIIAFWNSVRAFRAAYLRALLFLEVMKVYDGIVIDRKVEEGETVVSSMNAVPVLSIAEDLNTIWVSASIPEADI